MMRRLWILAVPFIVACGQKEAEPAPVGLEKSAAPAATASSSSAAGASMAKAPAVGTIVVKDAAGAEVVSIKTGATITISFTADGQRHVLEGTPRESGKRKYRIDQSAVMFEVKPGDEGFKLRTADGSLRWKVKVNADKVKISDNEQNNNPFEVKLKDGDRAKVVAPGDRELGRVDFDRATGKSVVKDAAGQERFRSDSAPSSAYGVLLLDTIPPPQRYILLAELLAK